jgi:hypothetical protein
MTPRDANFEGEENHTCLVRQELIVLYQRHLALQNAREKMKPFDQEVDEELKSKMPKLEEGKQPTEE